MATFDGLSKQQKIRATLHRDVRSICTETCHLLGLEITKPAMEIISELVYKKLAIIGSDLEAFAKHAKRATINSEDVKLLVRRNPSLKTHLTSLAPVASSVSKDKRRKTVVATTPRHEISRKQNEASVNKQPENRDTMEDTGKPKIEPKLDPKVAEKLEDMVIDDTIDLTFD